MDWGGRSLPSSTPVRFPLWVPDLRLRKLGMCFEPALVIGLVAHAVAPLSVLG